MSLHPDIAKELVDLRDSYLRSAEILTADKLAECYATFRRRFGPDMLARLDGVALLEGMHLHGNKDSLVYWLEFKNDEEMPGHFGSIAGGSALKFGIYRRLETGKWMTGSAQHQQELTLEQAIERARKHRDELIAGEGVSLEVEGERVRVPGFLFDMNRLFQAVLSRFLRENLVGFTVRDEYRLKRMLAYNPQHDPWKRPPPTPRPDYAVLHGVKVVALLDAKYMDLWDRRSIGRDVLYQLALYALSQPPGTPAAILYPATAPSARDARVDISDPVHGGQRAQVVARPVQLDRLEPLLLDAGGAAAVRERAAYAQWLAFGEA